MVRIRVIAYIATVRYAVKMVPADNDECQYDLQSQDLVRDWKRRLEKCSHQSSINNAFKTMG